MQLTFNHSTTYSTTAITAAAAPLTDYIFHLGEVAAAATYEAPEASINLPVDRELLMTVEAAIAPLVTPALRYIFVIGIGGSNLGTKAIYDALYGYQDMVETERPKIIFVDTTSAVHLQFYIDSIISNLESAAQYVVFTNSKSGGTTETLANTEILLSALATSVGNPAPRTVVITDNESDFATAAESAGVTHLTLPALVGGRYSVLSAVGLAPLLALGVDVDALRQGASDMREACLDTDMTVNPAAQSAALMAYALKDGKIINDTFVFDSELESLGKWYRQLLGESIGKEHNQAGAVVHQGITPTVSIGSTDLHSVGQLYLGGPKDKLTTFVYSLRADDELVVPQSRVFPNTVAMINGKTTTDIMQAILGGVKIAYNEASLPFMEVELSGITPYELGAFMQYKMFETMYLGQLLQVNPFDQPNVESYKVATKSILES